MDYIITTKHSSSELYHHGILGQKWGKKNGPPYPLEPSAHSSAEKKAGYTQSIKGSSNNQNKRTFNKETAKKVAIGVGTTAAVAAVAYVAIKHKPLVKAVLKDLSTNPARELRLAKNATIKAGADAVGKLFTQVGDAAKGFKSEIPSKPAMTGYSIGQTIGKGLFGAAKEGITEGAVEGTKKGTKLLASGLAMLGVKELSDMILGKNVSGKAFNANNKKKVGSFWKYEERDNSEDD